MFLNIGFDNYIPLAKIDSIIFNVESAPIKRKIQESRDNGILIEAARGRPIKSLILTSSYIYTSSLTSKALSERCVKDD